MAKAGFWAIDPTRKISFGKDGWWYANDERIQNKRINRLFSQSLRKNAHGDYEIAIGRDTAVVEIDDTPFVIIQVSEGRHGLLLHLNDDSQEPLAPYSLRLGPDNVLYCQVKGQTHAARFLRPAYYQLAAYIHVDTDGGHFYLSIHNTRYPIDLSPPVAD